MPSLKISVNIYQTIRRHIQEEISLEPQLYFVTFIFALLNKMTRIIHDSWS
jgi:hypothetical protein